MPAPHEHVHSGLIACLRWALVIWSSSFVALFALGLKWTELATLLYHRRLHASAEAPVLAGHISADMMIMVSGLLHGLTLFSQSSDTASAESDLLPIKARLWRYVTLRWVLRRLRHIVARTYAPLAFVLFVAYGVQSKDAYGQFRRAGPAELSSALWLSSPQGRYELQLAPWTWPMAHIVRYTFILYTCVFALVAAARVANAATSMFLSYAADSCGLGGAKAERSERPREQDGQGRQGKVTWADVKKDMRKACLSCTGRLPSVSPLLHGMNRLIFSYLDVLVVAVALVVFGYGCLWRYRVSPVITGNILRYSPSYVAAPFYDYLFTNSWAHAPSFAIGVVAAHWLARQPTGTATPLGTRIVGTMAAGFVLLVSAYDVTYWILSFPESMRQLLLALYLPAYSAAGALSLACALRSPTVHGLITGRYLGTATRVLTMVEPAALHVSLVQPLVLVGIVNSMPPSQDPRPGAASGYTALSLLAALPLGLIAAALHHVAIAAISRCTRARAVRIPARRAVESVARRVPVLGPLLRAAVLTRPEDGLKDGDGDDVTAAKAPEPALKDAWIMGDRWRDRLRRQLRFRGQFADASLAAEVAGAGREVSALEEAGRRRKQTEGPPTGSNAEEADEVSEEVARIRLVSAYILSRLADESEARRDGRPASAVSVVDSAVGAFNAVAARTVKLIEGVPVPPRPGQPVQPSEFRPTSAGRRNWSRTAVVPVHGEPEQPAEDSSPREGDEAGEEDVQLEADTPDDSPVERLRRWYMSASVSLAQEWAEASRADDDTLLALLKQLAEDVGEVIRGYQGQLEEAQEHEDTSDSSDSSDDDSEEDQDGYSNPPVWGQGYRDPASMRQALLPQPQPRGPPPGPQTDYYGGRQRNR